MKSTVTVTAPATSRLLVDPGYARQVLGWTTAEVSDQMLEEMIEGASAFVESWCDRKLIEETVLEEFFLENSVTKLFLTRRPVWATPEITVTDGDNLLLTTDWRIDYETGRMMRSPWASFAPHWGLWCGAATISVAYRGGYTVATETGGANVPPDLRDGVIEVLNATRGFLERDLSSGAVRSEEVPGAQVISYYDPNATSTAVVGSTPGMPASAESKLLPYKRKVRFA